MKAGSILGKCRVDGIVGEGNMGLVYRGKHLSLGVPVAIKTIKSELVQNKELIQRFHQEAQLAARLRHPNVVRVYDVGEQDGIHFIVMEFLEGMALDAYFRQNAPVDLDLFFHLFFQLASALGEAHRHGIIHRDVKPANVSILEGPKAVLTDFGIAAALSVDNRLTMPGILMGTPAYMSPEQARGTSNLDPRTDVFSLGMMMYEVLSGVLPQMSDALLEVIHRRASTQVSSLSSANPSISPPLEEVVMKALALDPSDRFADGDELAQALAEAHDAIFPSSSKPIIPDGKDAARSIVLPQEETTAIVSGSKIGYADIHALIKAVEQSSTDYGVVVVHQPDWADILLFCHGEVDSAFRWSADTINPIDYRVVFSDAKSNPDALVDSFEVSQRYSTALRVVCMEEPTIKGLRLAFVDMAKLIEHLTGTNQSGVLLLQSGKQVGMVLIRTGNLVSFFCSHWIDRETNLRSSFDGLNSVLRQHPMTRLDFFTLDSSAMQTQSLPVADKPFDSQDAEILVRFLVEAMKQMGTALTKQFGLGSGPILQKYLDLAADAYPEILSGLDYDETKSPDAEQLLQRIEQLPRTGRRDMVVEALAFILQQRARALKDALPNQRKLKKAFDPYVRLWKKQREELAKRDLSFPFESLYVKISSDMDRL